MRGGGAVGVLAPFVGGTYYGSLVAGVAAAAANWSISSSFTVSLEAAVGRPVAVLFLDLDGFKRVNDTLGHHAGDLLLVSVADRVRQRLRSLGLASSCLSHRSCAG